MYNVSIQVKQNGKDWEQTPKKFQAFKNWDEITNFAFRLSLFFDSEIRIENKGNGHYYNPIRALSYLEV